MLEISFFRKHNKHACILSLHLSSSLCSRHALSVFSLSSTAFPPILIFIISLSLFSFSSWFSIPPSHCLFSHPFFSLLSSLLPPPHQPKGLIQPPVCLQRAWEKTGHKQHSKQTTCFLLRSRVVKCVDRNRTRQPCSRIRTDRMNSGRKNQTNTAAIHSTSSPACKW